MRRWSSYRSFSQGQNFHPQWSLLCWLNLGLEMNKAETEEILLEIFEVIHIQILILKFKSTIQLMNIWILTFDLNLIRWWIWFYHTNFFYYYYYNLNANIIHLISCTWEPSKVTSTGIMVILEAITAVALRVTFDFENR